MNEKEKIALEIKEAMLNYKTSYGFIPYLLLGHLSQESADDSQEQLSL